jgi:FtsZ-binding cell division protein ZapB
MGIPFLGEVEKLINEHGSAAILKERIALANDKYAALEMKATDLTEKIAVLEAEKSVLQNEKSVLQAENERLKLDNEQLTSQIQNLNTTLSGHDNPLDEQKVNILKLLFKQDNLQTEQIAQSLNIELQVARFHLEEMKADIELIKRTSISVPRIERRTEGIIHHFDSVPVWAIGQKGRKYLIENGHV